MRKALKDSSERDLLAHPARVIAALASGSPKVHPRNGGWTVTRREEFPEFQKSPTIQ
jgi:hypothetical protein